MSAKAKGFAFAGPTLYALASDGRRDWPKVRWLPPVRRGDVARLVDTEPPQLLVIVDGQFQHCLSVSHREIRRAVETGWEVWGLASMGAIRACELRDFGMRGFGEVYRRFVLAEDFTDDEVALLHESQPPFRTFSEPLIHMRVALHDLVTQGVLSPMSSQRIVDVLASLWFGDRTLERLRELVLQEVSPSQFATVCQWLLDFRRYRIKSHDLENFMIFSRESKN